MVVLQGRISMCLLFFCGGVKLMVIVVALSSTENGSFSFPMKYSTRCIACLNTPTRATTVFRLIQV